MMYKDNNGKLNIWQGKEEKMWREIVGSTSGKVEEADKEWQIDQGLWEKKMVEQKSKKNNKGRKQVIHVNLNGWVK